MEKFTQTKDGVLLKKGHIPTPENMFFYEKRDGTIFNLSEEDAARIHSKFKFLGMSDGTVYCEKIKDLQGRFETMTMEEVREAMLQAWREEVERARGKINIPSFKPINLNMQNQVNLRSFKDEVK